MPPMRRTNIGRRTRNARNINEFRRAHMYVASSSVGKPSSLFIFAPENKTKNIVYQNAIY